MKKMANELKRMTHEEQKLVENNHNLIYGYLNKKDFDVEELYDIAAIGLCKASMGYDNTKGKFSTYAYMIMDNEIKKYFKSINRQRRKPTGVVLSYDEVSKINSNGDTGETFINSYIADNTNNYDDIMVDMDYSLFCETLNEREKKIMTYIESGYNQTEIGQMLNRSSQAISHVVCTVKKKWLKFIK